jgi:membrane fusion protein, multidrug efflux system
MTEPPARESAPPPPGRNRWRPVLVILVVILALAAAWAWWPRAPVPGSDAAQPATVAAHRGTGGRGRFMMAGPQPVGVAAVARGNIAITLNALGTVTPLATVTVRTQINGELVKLGFTEGQMVKKGQFLALIDPRPYQVALEQAQAQLARDQAILHGAQVDLDRYQRLARQKSIAQQQADDQLYLVRQYQGTVQLDQAQIDTAKLNLAYCTITSPVGGKAGLRQVDLGNYVTTQDTNGIVVVTQLQPITVVFPVPEDELPAIRERLNAGAKLSVTAFDRNLTHQLAAGTLYAVDSQIDPTTGTVRLKAEFPNTDNALFPQQFVNAQLLVNTLTNVVVAPTAAIQRGEPGTFVFKVVPGNKVSVTKVTLGPTEGQNVEILSGLQPGDEVVIDGADRLRDGSKITIPKATAGATGAAGATPANAAGAHPQPRPPKP